MRVLLFLKITILVAALAGVIFAIRHLNSDSMNKAFLALGVEPGTAQSPGFQPGHRAAGAGEERYNICPTRIHALIMADGRKVEESKQGLKLKWMAHDPQAREISYLDIEKWLSRHCQIHIAKASEQDQAISGYRDYLLIKYIDGTEKKIEQQAGEGDPALFMTDGKVFRSDDLKEAIAELKQIAIFN